MSSGMGGAMPRGVYASPTGSNLPGVAGGLPFLDDIGGRTAKKMIERVTSRYPGYKPAVNVLVIAPKTTGSTDIFQQRNAGNRDEYDWRAASAHAKSRAGMKLLLVKKKVRDPTIPDAWTFPSAELSHDDDVEADRNGNFTEQMMGGAFPALPERAAAVRALYQDAGFTANRNIELTNRRWSRMDYSCVGKLVPFSRWASPAGDPTKFDTLNFCLPIDHTELRKMDKDTFAGATGVPFDPDLVDEAAFVDPVDALRRHEDPSSGLKLPPPELLTVHFLSRFSHAKAAVTDASDRYSYHLDDMPRVQPKVSFDKDTRQFTFHLMAGATHLPPGEHFFSTGIAAGNDEVHPMLRVSVEEFDSKAQEFVSPMQQQHKTFDRPPVW